ncbi:uncharacterized protein LOC135394056 [Ornithodoros turicata]|uniref:uncharacterized protein LOC135394056 n=1 Tax=Ornithodoros turicata TaxID=34597 RepID=UPI003138DF55
MSSAGAANPNTANTSRDSTTDSLANSSSDNYRLLLPTLPTGNISFNTVFLHADPSGRPYRADDFAESVLSIIDKEDVAQFGAYLYNHVWALTLHSRLPKERLVAKKQISVKNKKCIIIDPNEKDVHLSLHWLPMHIPDIAVVNALSGFGKVEKIEREKWRSTAFAGAETTTRRVSMVLRDGVSVESIPHIMRILGGQVLVDIPGRPPLCLRCKKIGHFRKNCSSSWCKACRRFGHDADDCVSTYASKTRAAVEDASVADMMDVEDTAALHPRPEGDSDTSAQNHQGHIERDDSNRQEAATQHGDKETVVSYENTPAKDEEHSDDVSESNSDDKQRQIEKCDAQAVKEMEGQETLEVNQGSILNVKGKEDDSRNIPESVTSLLIEECGKGNVADGGRNDLKWKDNLKKSRYTPAPLITPEERRRLLKDKSKLPIGNL